MRAPAVRRRARCYPVLAIPLAVGLVLDAGASRADPPPWAPAHGYRAKQSEKPGHPSRRHLHDSVAYEEQTRAFGILDGACYREKVGAVIGGVLGGVAGSRIGKGDGRAVATIAGTALGVLAGAAIGRRMDETDQHCVAQSLERAPDGHTVAWRLPDGSHYEVTPLRTMQRDDRYCREYRTEARVDGERQRVLGTACRDAQGGWQIPN